MTSDVLVIGGGIIGLTAAVRLLHRGATVSLWAADAAERTVSAVAAAAWYPSHTVADNRMLDWATGSYDEFRRQAGQGAPGVAMRATRMLLRADSPAGLPWWASPSAGVVRRAAPAPYAGELRFTAPVVEMDRYLPWLLRRITDAGGRVVRRRVSSLADALAEAPVVVNATGLAAGALCADPAVYPARGHVVLVANPGLDTSVRDEGNPAGITYAHPRSRDVVLGGTFEAGRADLEPDPGAREQIVRRCVALVPELAGAPVLGERIGLRPARHGGPRVETETVDGGRIVHAYGHGGAGMTLAWGCADTVATLALA